VDEFRERTLKKNQLEREMDLKEEQRASANATAKANIKQLGSEVADIRNQLDEGAEPRDVDAVVVFDKRKGVKTFWRFCPGQPGHDEKLKVENMTDDDYQALPLEDGEKPKDPATPGKAAPDYQAEGGEPQAEGEQPKE
jgi:hypothetical protein